MERCRKSLSETPGPVMAEDIPDVRVDLRGVQPSALSAEEKARFVSAPAGW